MERVIKGLESLRDEMQQMSTAVNGTIACAYPKFWARWINELLKDLRAAKSEKPAEEWKDVHD